MRCEDMGLAKQKETPQNDLQQCNLGEPEGLTKIDY